MLILGYCAQATSVYCRPHYITLSVNLRGGPRRRIPVFLQDAEQTCKEDPMNQDQTPVWRRWAQFRFAVIGELLSCPPPKGRLQQAIARLAGQTYQHPVDANRRMRIGASTIERWYYKARFAADPIGALGRKMRHDAGLRPSMALLRFLRNNIYMQFGILVIFKMTAYTAQTIQQREQSRDTQCAVIHLWPHE